MKRNAKACEHRAGNKMMPCYIENGTMAVIDGVHCAGCGKKPEELEHKEAAPVPAAVPETVVEVKLTPEQLVAVKKITKITNVFSKQIKQKLFNELLDGNMDWKTWHDNPPWKFIDGVGGCIDKIRAGEDLKSNTAKLAMYCMLINLCE